MGNNLKMIRELYGATQEQVATAINVNRVTVANWESGSSMASSSNQEKLSIYYGIGPEYFYRQPLDETARQLLVETGKKDREVAEQTKGQRVKEDDFHKFFESTSFKDAMTQYMLSMKLLLATADNGELDTLETALLINKKMGARLEAMIELRKKEQRAAEPTILELLKKLENN